MKVLDGMDKRIKPCPKPHNKSEALFYEWADGRDWIITKRGAPDFACFLPDGDFVFVEVKPKRSNKLKAWQWKVMEKLSSLGIKCYRWSPDTGFTRMGYPEKEI